METQKDYLEKRKTPLEGYRQERVVMLVDMNSYFASVEQVANPALRGKPIAVGGEGRTVIVTASYEARKYGVKTGMTVPEARKLCPHIIFVHGNLDKYIDTSHRIHKIFLEFTDYVDVFSIDECFLDITHLVRKGSGAQDVGMAIKKRLKEEFGLICSIGIGPNRLIAKLASKFQKPDGLVEVSKEEIPELFSNLPVEELQGVGIGAKLSHKLNTLNIYTAKDIGDASISMLTSYFGVMGYHLKRMGRGEDDSKVRKYWEDDEVKSVGHSYTLPKDTRDLKVIKSYLRVLSEKVGNRLRAANLTGRTIGLVVRYSDFHTIIKHCTLKHHIKSGYDIYINAYKVFEKLLPLLKAVRLLGVNISNLLRDDKQQYFLDDISKQQKVVEMVDDINRKYGEFTLKPSSMLIADKFGK